MAGAVVLILVLLFVAPFVLGSYVVVQMFTPRGQVTYFGFVTVFLVGKEDFDRVQRDPAELVSVLREQAQAIEHLRSGAAARDTRGDGGHR